MEVKKQVKVPLSIGKTYQDEVVCDVVIMDAYHSLLGRPWKFDISVLHDGRKNTYCLKFSKKKIVVTPLITKPSHIDISYKKSIVNGKVIYLLVLLEDDEGKVCNEPIVRVLLEEFVDVFPTNLPHVLPPIRVIEHQIDFIHTAILPNKVAYRCNPKEALE